MCTTEKLNCSSRQVPTSILPVQQEELMVLHEQHRIAEVHWSENAMEEAFPALVELGRSCCRYLRSDSRRNRQQDLVNLATLCFLIAARVASGVASLIAGSATGIHHILVTEYFSFPNEITLFLLFTTFGA